MRIIPYFVALPLITAILTLVLGRFYKKTGIILSNLTALALTVLSLSILFSGAYPLVYKMGGWEPVAGIPVGIYLVVDGLSILVLAVSEKSAKVPVGARRSMCLSRRMLATKDTPTQSRK